MSRSSKKGPFVDPNLVKKIGAGMGTKDLPISNAAKYFQVHNGRIFIDVFVSEDMVGHRLGEFAPTRTFRGHGEIVKRILEKT